MNAQVNKETPAVWRDWRFYLWMTGCAAASIGIAVAMAGLVNLVSSMKLTFFLAIAVSILPGVVVGAIARPFRIVGTVGIVFAAILFGAVSSYAYAATRLTALYDYEVVIWTPAQIHVAFPRDPDHFVVVDSFDESVRAASRSDVGMLRAGLIMTPIAAVVFSPLAAGCVLITSPPSCRRCRRPLKLPTQTLRIARLPFSAGVPRRVKESDISLLDQVEPARENAAEYLQFEVYSCELCTDSVYLTVRDCRAMDQPKEHQVRSNVVSNHPISSAFASAIDSVMEASESSDTLQDISSASNH
ncbi:MAG: hypothetical protein AAGH92_05545 [Planctomycetota bacterium]